LAPDRIARAVAEFEGRGEAVARRTTLGMPTRVERVLSLPRAPTDQEWEFLVSDLRTTFGGKGEVTSQGGFRVWSRGDLHAFIEPTESGYRLRLTESMTIAFGTTFLGGLALAFALLIFLILLGKDDPGFRFVVPAFFGLIGGGLIAGTGIVLPRWAREREAQMEHIASRASAIIGSPPSNDVDSAIAGEE
jgi:hypothetical protein